MARPIIAVTGTFKMSNDAAQAAYAILQHAVETDNAILRTGSNRGIEGIAREVGGKREGALEVYSTDGELGRHPQHMPMHHDERARALVAAAAGRSIFAETAANATYHPYLLFGTDLQTPANALLVHAHLDAGSMRGQTQVAYELARRTGISTENLIDERAIARAQRSYARFSERGFFAPPSASVLAMAHRIHDRTTAAERERPRILPGNLSVNQETRDRSVYVGRLTEDRVRAIVPHAEVLTRLDDGSLLPYAAMLQEGGTLRVLGDSAGQRGLEHRVADRIAWLTGRLRGDEIEQQVPRIDEDREQTAELDHELDMDLSLEDLQRG